jgi:hypothetical protein
MAKQGNGRTCLHLGQSARVAFRSWSVPIKSPNFCIRCVYNYGTFAWMGRLQYIAAMGEAMNCQSCCISTIGDSCENFILQRSIGNAGLCLLQTSFQKIFAKCFFGQSLNEYPSIKRRWLIYIYIHIRGMWESKLKRAGSMKSTQFMPIQKSRDLFYLFSSL